MSEPIEQTGVIVLEPYRLNGTAKVLKRIDATVKSIVLTRMLVEARTKRLAQRMAELEKDKTESNPEPPKQGLPDEKVQ